MTIRLTSARHARVGLVAAATALFLLTPTGSAFAHNAVVSTTPAEGETLTELPAVFEIVTNDQMLDIAGDGTGFALQVSDADGLFYGDGCLTVDGAAMSMPATLGEAGTYTLAYQLISADSHTLSGEFTFDYAPAADAVVTPGSPEPLRCGDPIPGGADPAPSEVPDAGTSDEPSATDSAEPSAEASPSPDASEPADADTTSDAGSLPVGAIVGIIAAVLVIGAGIGIALARRRRA